jgi:hypothetical protein
LVLKLDDLEYEFDSIAFAQGQSGSRNNWWFGGKMCQYIGDHKVSVFGTAKNGKKYKFVFLRGGNNVNEIQIVSKEEI